MTGPDIRPAAGPRWTRKRLVDMLIACYGPSPRGAVDVAAVAAAAGVGESTVRRWITRGDHANNRRPAIPARRLAQLHLGPPDLEYRTEPVADIAVERNIEESWRRRGWLDDQTVSVIAVHARPWHQVVISNGSARSQAELRRRGATIDSVVVPTRFHAQVLAHAVMLTQQAWRLHPAPTELKTGATTVWMADAPQVNLKALLHQVLPALRRAKSRRTIQRSGE
jgi:hypothetical protein